jgi:hypothetical protein
MNATILASIMGQPARGLPAVASADVVELGLLLPANRAAELLRLAQDRHESVGQLLRKLIDRELARSA